MTTIGGMNIELIQFIVFFKFEIFPGKPAQIFSRKLIVEVSMFEGFDRRTGMIRVRFRNGARV